MLETSVGEGKILIVGAAPSRGDFLAQKPYIGMTGKDLDNMLHEAGIIRTDCHITFVRSEPVPGFEVKRFFEKYTKAYQIPTIATRQGTEKLHELISDLRPNLVIALGDLPLWALTGEIGITKWRGSILECESPSYKAKVLPTYAPEVIARKYDWRFIAVQDFRRAEKESQFPEIKMPEYDFWIRPSFEKVMEILDMLLDKANGKSQ